MTADTLEATSATHAPARPAVDLAMTRYAGGDSSAGGELARALGPRLLAALRKLCRSEELARDLTQETFLRMHRARRSFESGRAAWPWAYAIAFNCFLSHARAWSTRLAQASVPAEHAELRAPADDSEARAAARQALRRLQDALSSMPEARQAILLMRAEELQMSEIARELDITEGAAKLRAFRAAQSLRAALSSDEPGPAALGASPAGA